MTAVLEPLRHALAALPDQVLHAVRRCVIQSGHVAPCFTAWIKHVVDWEIDRRAGAHYFMLFPEELVPLHEFTRGARCTLDRIAAELSDATLLAEGQGLLHSLRVLVARCEAYRPG